MEFQALAVTAQAVKEHLGQVFGRDRVVVFNRMPVTEGERNENQVTMMVCLRHASLHPAMLTPSSSCHNLPCGGFRRLQVVLMSSFASARVSSQPISPSFPDGEYAPLSLLEEIAYVEHVRVDW